MGQINFIARHDVNRSPAAPGLGTADAVASGRDMLRLAVRRDMPSAPTHRGTCPAPELARGHDAELSLRAQKCCPAGCWVACPALEWHVPRGAQGMSRRERAGAYWIGGTVLGRTTSHSAAAAIRMQAAWTAPMGVAELDAEPADHRGDQAGHQERRGAEQGGGCSGLGAVFGQGQHLDAWGT